MDAAIVPDRLPLRATNFGFAGATPVEVYFFVKRAMACPVKPRLLFLSFGTEEFSIIRNWLWENAIRYRALGWPELGEIRDAANRLGDRSYFSITTHDGLSGWLRDLVYLCHFPSIYFNSLMAGRIFQRQEANAARFAAVRAARGYWSYGTGEAPGAVAADLSFRPLPLQIYFFEKTLRLLQQNTVAVDFLITPVSGNPSQPRDNGDFVHYLQYLYAMADKFPNFHIIQQRVPVWPGTMFVDGAHLNSNGAAAFSTLLSSCMNRIAASGASATCAFDVN